MKARLRDAIMALITAVVVVLSLLYLSDFTKASFSAASDRAGLVDSRCLAWRAETHPRSGVRIPLRSAADPVQRKLRSLSHAAPPPHPVFSRIAAAVGQL